MARTNRVRSRVRPDAGRPSKFARTRQHESLMTPFPSHAINLDGAFVDAKNIEGIELPPPASGCGGAGLNQQNRAIGDAISRRAVRCRTTTRRAVRCRTTMKMARQDEIN